MIKYSIAVATVSLFASCTAINQKDALLDDLTSKRPVDNLVFSDDFENGLGKWNQTSGSWITSTPGSGGLALQSPSSATPATFSIATAASIDLTGKSQCVLEYDTQYLLKGVAGVSAKVLFGSTVVGTFKDTSGLSDISSATNFVHRKALLPDNGTGRISFVSSVTNNTTGYADWRIDNVIVKCNASIGTTVTLVDENFDVSATNWALVLPWLRGAAAGAAASGGIWTDLTGYGNAYTGNVTATYTPSISLTNRYNCSLEYYYVSSNIAAGNCMSLEWNSNSIWALCGAGTTGTNKILLTATEDTAANTLNFRCRDTDSSPGGNITCTVDKLKLTCQQ
jgi:hypothetical protein